MSLTPDRPLNPDLDPHTAAAEKISLHAQRAPTTQWDRRYLVGGALALATVLGVCLIVAMVAAENRTKHRGKPGDQAAASAPPEASTPTSTAGYNTLMTTGGAAPPSCAQFPGYVGCSPNASAAAAPGQSKPAAASTVPAISPREQGALNAASSSVLVGGPQAASAAVPAVDAGAAFAVPAPSTTTVADVAAGEVSAQNGQLEKRAFAGSTATQDYVKGVLQHPRSPYEVKAGSVISAALITAINSDLPGEVVAQVTEPVYDHRTGRVVLIPQGARLVGVYDSQVAYGQARALVAWNRIIMPNGDSINIGSMGGADLTGASGLHDRVNQHFGDILKGILLSTLISIGASSAESASTTSSGSTVLNNAGSGIANAATQTGDRITDRQLNRQPTIEIRAGWALRVIVSKDMVLEPYRP
jgi:type IV secretion system protein VirB10